MKMLATLLSEAVKGRIDYYRFPERRDIWGGAFNGQARRKEQFQAIVENCKPTALVETGTFRGATTLYLSAVGLPVYTIEGNARNYGFAKSQLHSKKNVMVIGSDSREGLRSILGGPLRPHVQSPIFFYLDAHWNADLPLGEELEIILASCARPLIMIDDFAVAGDDGYGFDDYGGGSVLNYNYVAKYVAMYGLESLYPTAPSSAETGAKRGNILLCEKGLGGVLLATGLFRH